MVLSSLSVTVGIAGSPNRGHVTYPCEVEGARIGAQPGSVVERGDGRHVVFGQFEIEHVEVTHDPLWVHRLRDDDITELQMPPNQYLRRRLVARSAIAVIVGMIQQPALTQRAPRLGRDPQLGMHLPQLDLRQQWMQLDLVDGGHDPGRVDQDAQVLRREVARRRSSGSCPGRAMRERVEGVDELVHRRHRPMDQVEVEVAPVPRQAQCWLRTRSSCCRNPGRHSTAWSPRRRPRAG